MQSQGCGYDRKITFGRKAFARQRVVSRQNAAFDAGKAGQTGPARAAFADFVARVKRCRISGDCNRKLWAFIAAVWVLGEGLRAEDDWRARAVAKAPRVKLKLLSAAMMGAAIGLAFVSDHNTSGLASVMAAVLGAGLHLSAFGFDPSTDKQGCGITAFDAERIDELSTAVDPHLARISTLAKASGDAALMQESAALLIVVTHRMQALKANPQAATQVRKMVSVWLPALAQAMQQGHDLEAIGHKPERIDKLAETMSEVRSRIEAMVISTQASADTRLESDLAVLRDSLR